MCIKRTSTLPSVRVAAGLVITLCVGLFSSRASAVILNPGFTVSTTGGGTFSGTSIYDVTTPFISSVSSFTGSLRARVFRESGGTLDFVYQFSNDNNPNNDPISKLTASNFGGFSTNADDQTVGGDVSPFDVSRSSGVGNVIGFDFSGVGPGQSSDLLIVDTNATQYDIGSVSLQDSGQASVPAPEPAVPEPASVAILTLAVSALGFRRNRNR